MSTKQNNQIKYILFDLADVIIEGLIKIEFEIAKFTDVPVDIISKALRGPKLREYFEGKLSEFEYWRLVIEEAKIDLPFEKLADITRKKFKKDMPGTKDIIKKLKNKGYKLALLSDHYKEWIEFIKEHHEIEELFETIIFSYEIGSTKLEEKSFHKALLEANFEPKQTLFIDDSLKNITIAQKVGITKTHQFYDSKKLEEFLIAQKILL